MSYSVDISDAMRELRRIDDGPDPATILKLDAVLVTQFQLTQEHVHILSGALRESGRLTGSVDAAGYWEGGFSYGGQTSVPDWEGNPIDVDYAAEELGRAPGGPFFFTQRGFLPGIDIMGRESIGHDYLAVAETVEPAYGRALMSYLRGEH